MFALISYLTKQKHIDICHLFPMCLPSTLSRPEISHQDWKVRSLLLTAFVLRACQNAWRAEKDPHLSTVPGSCSALLFGVILLSPLDAVLFRNHGNWGIELWERSFPCTPTQGPTPQRPCKSIQFLEVSSNAVGRGLYVFFQNWLMNTGQHRECGIHDCHSVLCNSNVEFPS